jgi:RND family efflux transporter MFP subunit
MRAVLLSLAIIIAAGAGFFFWSRAREGASSEAGDVSRIRTATVQRGNVSFMVSVAGEIGPAEQVSVRPEVNGRISELPVDVGDRVPKGGLLFSLDDRDLRIEVEAREKQIESANLQLEKAVITMEQARRVFQRDEELYEAGLLSAQEYESSRQQYESSVKDHELARNSIERAQQELALARERLDKTRIVAPFDCTVLTRPVSVGQAVSGSGGFNSGTEVLTIADLSSMVINAHVNQIDITHLRQGMEVAVEVDAVPGLIMQGEVERITPQATVKNSIKGYATRIVLKRLDPRVRPGMTATISIPVATADNVLTVPLAAIFSEEGDRYVLVRTGNTFERRPVTIGVSDYFSAEVRSGLDAGEVVALEQPPGVSWRMPGAGPGMSQGQRGSGGGTPRALTAAPTTPTAVAAATNATAAATTSASTTPASATAAPATTTGSGT